jgi:hypothetical protein
MNSITVANVNIDIHDGPLGISVSGGADSAIMLYILMKYAPGPIHVYTCVSKVKNRTAPYTALDVIGKCIDMTGRKDNEIFHHSSFVDKSYIDNMYFLCRNDLDNNVINYVYTGLTTWPPLEVRDSFNIRPHRKEGVYVEDREPEIEKPVYAGRDNKFYAPFRNVNKSVICEAYKELNVLEELFPITRSCESFTLTKGHCGECWWCEERQWGFGRLE